MRIEAETLKNSNGIAHGFFTREGGVSDGIYASLNCGLGSKDKPEAVLENRERVAGSLGVEREALLSCYQYHSTEVFVAEKPWSRDEAPRADALVTAQPGLAIGVSTADCVPVLFSDAEAKVVGAAHAGWRGALTGVLEATIDKMVQAGAAKDRILAAIGPAISQKAYEVGPEFEQNFLEASAENAKFFRRPDPESRPYFDLTGYVAERLNAAQIGSVEELNICTYAAGNGLFSYRRSCHAGEDDYGRQISAIVIPR